MRRSTPRRSHEPLRDASAAGSVSGGAANHHPRAQDQDEKGRTDAPRLRWIPALNARRASYAVISGVGLWRLETRVEGGPVFWFLRWIPSEGRAPAEFEERFDSRVAAHAFALQKTAEFVTQAKEIS